MVDSDSDLDEIERIRQQKREQLIEAKMEGEKPSVPDKPVYADSPGDFKSFVATHDVVLVDFYADWCGPCQMLEPIVNAVAHKTPGAVLKVDIDKHASLAREYGVQGVPTLLVFADGQPVKRLVGVQDEGTLTSLVEKYAG